MTGPNPCRWSPEVLDVIEPLLITMNLAVHDPFAGDGTRLGALCDRLGLPFTGTDIEDWPDYDERVMIGDSADPSTYPNWAMDSQSFIVVTSPVYQNKRCADYKDGPTPTTKTKGRRDYGIALGRALHEHNLARLTGRPRLEDAYYEAHAEIVKLWPANVILNVDEPIAAPWRQILLLQDYAIQQTIPAYTRRYRGLDNADKRAEHEVVIVAVRT